MPGSQKLRRREANSASSSRAARHFWSVSYSFLAETVASGATPFVSISAKKASRSKELEFPWCLRHRDFSSFVSCWTFFSNLRYSTSSACFVNSCCTYVKADSSPTLSVGRTISPEHEILQNEKRPAREKDRVRRSTGSISPKCVPPCCSWQHLDSAETISLGSS